MRKLLSLGVFVFLLAPCARAQFLGNVAIQTVTSQVAPSGTVCTGSNQTFATNMNIAQFNNIGQTLHQASATSNAASLTLEIDGIDAQGNVVRISNPTVSYQPTNLLTGYVSQGQGYYPNIQIVVNCTAAATFSLSYSGSTGGGGSSIIATPGTTGTPGGGIAANVQGMIPTGQNGIPIFPLLLGGLGPATNGAFLKQGIDTFSQGGTAVPNGTTGTVTLANPPTPTNPAGQQVFAFYGGIAAAGSASLAGPWSCLGGCGVSDRQFNTAFLANYTTKNSLQETFANGGGGFSGVQFVSFSKGVTIATNSFTSSNTTSVTPNAGDVMLAVFSCSGAGVLTCGITSVTDTHGTVYTLIGVEASNDSATGQNVVVNTYTGTNPTTGADTITFAGTNPGQLGIQFIALRNVVASSPNTPSTPISATSGGTSGTTSENDLGGIFTEMGGYSFTQTLTITANTTIGLWAPNVNGVFYSCTMGLRVTAASGTTPTLDTFLQDSPDNVGWNDRMHFTQATAAGNFLGAVSGGVGGINPVATTNGVLAAGTKLDGPLSAFGRVVLNVGGTTPSFTITFNVACR